MQAFGVFPSPFLNLPQRFDARDVLAIRLRGKHHTTCYWLAIKQHGTRAAFAIFAAVLDAKIAIAAERVQKRFVGGTLECFVIAVNYEIDLHRKVPRELSSLGP